MALYDFSPFLALYFFPRTSDSTALEMQNHFKLNVSTEVKKGKFICSCNFAAATAIAIPPFFQRVRCGIAAVHF
jgi:hypothetical protein